MDLVVGVNSKVVRGKATGSDRSIAGEILERTCFRIRQKAQLKWFR